MEHQRIKMLEGQRRNLVALVICITAVIVLSLGILAACSTVEEPVGYQGPQDSAEITVYPKPDNQMESGGDIWTRQVTVDGEDFVCFALSGNVGISWDTFHCMQILHPEEFKE